MSRGPASPKRAARKFRRQVGLLAIAQRYDHATRMIVLRLCSRMLKAASQAKPAALTRRDAR